MRPGVALCVLGYPGVIRPTPSVNRITDHTADVFYPNRLQLRPLIKKNITRTSTRAEFFQQKAERSEWLKFRNPDLLCYMLMMTLMKSRLKCKLKRATSQTNLLKRNLKTKRRKVHICRLKMKRSV